MKTLNKKLEEQLIQNLIVQNIQEVSSSQWFYSVIHYGDYGNDGIRKEWEEMRWMYNKTHMTYKVHPFLKRLLKEHFKNECIYFTLERHQGNQEKIEDGPHLQYGDTREGKYHTNILISPISDNLIENPHSKLSRLWEEPGRMGLPIHSLQYGEDLIDLKIDLINSCLRKCPWVNRYTPSVKTQVLEDVEDLFNTGHYTLKDISRKGLDFMDVLDTHNSDIQH
tara:strand:- start:490 stop:1158 length:669 start_codon:yes stop_codon:yes gene_type:complete